MGKKKKKEQEVEQQYLLSRTNVMMLNYKVYWMSKWEKIGCFLCAFALGAAIGYLFYGGIGKDAFGNPTKLTWILNITIPTIVGLIAGKMFLPIRCNQVIKKRARMLNGQFRDMLEALTTSLGAGKNVTDSFYAVYDDLRVQYEEDAFILSEVQNVINGIQNNIAIEDILMEFGERSGNKDIKSFATVFQISYRKGGNTKDIIRNTHEILSDKMEITEEIETIVSANKTEQNVMVFMPIALIAIIKVMSPEFGKNFVSLSGIISTTIAIGMFALAYWVGKEILDIKV